MFWKFGRVIQNRTLSKSEFSEVLEIYFSGTYTLNIVPKSVSKEEV